MIGTVLNDRWKIAAELGHGGMGAVYLATNVLLERDEALKILSPSLAADPRFVSRFRREARAVNRLRHPNIIALFDYGQLADGRFYLAMEYADGESVQQLIQRECKAPVDRALHLLGQLAHAVHHAHSRGVVHRDLKPANLIVVDREQTLKVLDFGVAKIVAADHADSMALSSGNVVLGTAKYLAPERVRGVACDPRSDLYAIGCIAYELVVGTPPFTGTADEMIRAHLTQAPVAPSEARPEQGIPSELDAVILHCLAKAPDERMQTAAELYAGLTKVPGYATARPNTRKRIGALASSDELPGWYRPRTSRATTESDVLRELEALTASGLEADDPKVRRLVAQLASRRGQS